MKRIRTLCFLVPALLLLGGSVCAQHVHPRRAATPKRPHLSGKERTYHLYKRTHETWHKANEKSHEFKVYSAGMLPSKQISAKLTINPYPKNSPAHSLKDADQWTYYLLAKNNLEIRKWLPKIDKTQQFISEYADALLAMQEPVTHPVSQDAPWLVSQISPDTRYLLLGEWHNQADVQNFEEKFLQELYKSGREIILFTEFIPDGASWTVSLEHDELADYLPIWFAANARQIPIIGLEPEYFYKDNNNFLIREETFLFPPTLQERQDVWASPEGMRLRNEHWLSILERYRQQHPDALFVILAGADHLSYTQPYSLGSHLPVDQTQCILLPPHAYAGQSEPFLTLFDVLTNEQLSQRIIQFKDRSLARQVGFDIQLKVTPPQE